MSDAFPTAHIRLRLGQEDAHYGGNLVAGATQLRIVGDLITELAMRYDGDEGLFRAYESVEFLAPLYAGRLDRGDAAGSSASATRAGGASSRSARSARRGPTSPRAPRSSSTSRSSR